MKESLLNFYFQSKDKRISNVTNPNAFSLGPIVPMLYNTQDYRLCKY
jgi:hypothetical protein